MPCTTLPNASHVTEPLQVPLQCNLNVHSHAAKRQSTAHLHRHWPSSHQTFSLPFARGSWHIESQLGAVHAHSASSNISTTYNTPSTTRTFSHNTNFLFLITPLLPPLTTKHTNKPPQQRQPRCRCPPAASCCCPSSAASCCSLPSMLSTPSRRSSAWTLSACLATLCTRETPAP